MNARTATLPDVVALLKPGMSVFVPGMSGESQAFFEALQSNPEKAAGVRFLGVHFPEINRNDYLGLHPQARQRAYFMMPQVRSGALEGRAELMPLDYLGTLRDVKQQQVDMAIAQVSPPDADGNMSLGLNYDFLPAVWHNARIKVAHINPGLLRTRGSFGIKAADCDFICEAESNLITYDGGEPNQELTDIATGIAGIMRDGDTLQVGIGKMQVAIMRGLTGHRRLRIYSGMVTEAALPLIDAGVIAGEGAIEAGVALGNEELYRRVGEDKTFYFRPVSETHDIRRVAAIPNFVSVNAAIEIDLFGQVNCDSIDGKLLAGVGGMPAFVQGAQLSEGGRAAFCLPATTGRGKVSRIVSRLGLGSFVGSPRHAADVVVTEFGVAELRGLSLHARAEKLIELAAPAFREELTAQWHALRSRL
ncbi:MAG: acetyl-CoA hydrolase [Rhodocyclaceae bacterium]|jgi:acyl-CoA hydrolase|nr:acetyl-CoA hydrolase [Rhodocyclaceae bacterium]